MQLNIDFYWAVPVWNDSLLKYIPVDLVNDVITDWTAATVMEIRHYDG